jgi:hypothetical protein
MSEIISAVGGGAIVSAILTAVVTMLVRPKALLALLVVVTAPFPGSRLYQRYSAALAVVHGLQPTPVPEEKPALPKGKNKRRGK